MTVASLCTTVSSWSRTRQGYFSIEVLPILFLSFLIIPDAGRRRNHKISLAYIEQMCYNDKKMCIRDRRMTIEERKNAILAKITEIKASGGEEQLKELDEAYKKGVDSL